MTLVPVSNQRWRCRRNKKNQTHLNSFIMNETKFPFVNDYQFDRFLLKFNKKNIIKLNNKDGYCLYMILFNGAINLTF